MKTGAVIAAAGLSSRMGDFKPMLQIGSITIIKRIILTFQQAGVDTVIVVTGNQAERLERHLAKMNVICLRNEDYAHSQMLDSVKIGLACAAEICDRVLFTPVDVPLFTAETVAALMAEPEPVVVPVCAGIDGHPIVLDGDTMAFIGGYGGEGGLRGAIQASGAAVRRLEVADRGILFDADTPEDYGQLLTWHNAQLIHPRVKVTLAREEEFFGPGTEQLLRYIQLTHSVRTSCSRMGVSYSKGWKIIAVLEKAMGYPIVARRQGGVGGGWAELTPEGEELLLLYQRLSQESASQVRQLFERYFKSPVGKEGEG